MRFKIQDKWKWVSEDRCGRQYFYRNQPTLKDNGVWSIDRWHSTHSPITFDLGPDYRDSLHQVVDGELVKCKEPKPVCADCEELKRKVRALAESNNVETLLRACRGLALDPMPSTLKVDDKVWVASSVADGWVPRHYSGASSTPGNIWCFNNSRTSFTIGKGGTTEWSIWKRAIDGVDPNES